MVNMQKLRCEVTQIIDHRHGVYSLELRPEHKLPRFHPGQFMHLAIDPYEPGDFWPESRVFSIANSPEDRNKLCLSYSVVGRFTTRMEQELDFGNQVWVKLPYGDFIIRGSRDIALIAGGTGITAFTAFVQKLSPEFKHAVHLFYGARNEDLLIYQEAIDRMDLIVPQFHVTYYAETRIHRVQCTTEINEGRPSADRILADLTTPQETDFYLSGPPPMLVSLTQQLGLSGINADAIHIDAWGQLTKSEQTNDLQLAR